MGFTDDVKGKAEQLGDTIGDRASDALDTAKDKAEDAWDVVSDKAEEVIEVVRGKASELLGSVQERLEPADPVTGPVDAEPEVQQDPVEDFAAAGASPTDADQSPMSRDSIIAEAAAETERHVQPDQL